MFGDWNGETVAMTINGKVAWSRTFRGSGSFAHECPSLLALSVPVEAIVEDTEPSVQITFLSS